MLSKIAFRNILRNRRRSAMTVLAIAVGAVAIVLFGEFVAFIRAGLETNAVQKVGHLTVFRRGYFDYGAGNPAAFGIDDYQALLRLVRDDPEVGPKLNVVTPTVSLTGIAGNFDIDTSKTFLGTGVVPSDRERMQQWDEHGVNRRRVRPESGLRDDDETRGVVGVGMARVLGLCDALRMTDCPPRPAPSAAAASATPATPLPSDAADLAALARADRGPSDGAPSEGVAAGAPRLDLLAATANGAPNVLSLFVSRAEPQGARELDDNVVLMHFGLAQKLLYGRGERKAIGIVLQLRRTEDMPVVRARLNALFRERGLDLEVRDFAEREPFYKQAVGMFGAIFLFIALIMGVIVAFTVVNTMGMSVMERTNEIGTVRALGARPGGVRRLFVVEGAMLGALGATLGVGIGQTLAVLFNRSGAMWTPPGQAAPLPLEVMTSDVGRLLLGAWIGLVILSTVAALAPANRAARLKVVDALRHV
jgi:putative ABC transport system permease protein